VLGDDRDAGSATRDRLLASQLIDIVDKYLYNPLVDLLRLHRLVSEQSATCWNSSERFQNEFHEQQSRRSIRYAETVREVELV
jgi:hypothetical protein